MFTLLVNVNIQIYKVYVTFITYTKNPLNIFKFHKKNTLMHTQNVIYYL